MGKKAKRQQYIPSIKKDKKCFQYTIIVALNHEEIKKYPERITKIKPFINKHKWEGINVPSEKDDCKTFEKNKVAIPLNFLYAKNEKKSILLMFQNKTQIVKNK